MSPENYTFACPACGIHLGVPRSLAGVRGPCPQCHREITAPEPTDRVFPTPFADLPGAATAARHPVAPAPAPEPPPRDEVTLNEEEAPLDEPDFEETDGPSITAEVRSRGSSRWVAVCASLTVLVLVAAAGLVLLPRATLRAWMTRSGKPTSGNIPSQATAASVAGTTPNPIADHPTPPPPEAAPSSIQEAPVETVRAVESLVPMPPVPPSGAADTDPSSSAGAAATTSDGKAPPSAASKAPVTRPASAQVAKALDPPTRPTDPPSLLPDLAREAATSQTDREATARPASPGSELAEPMKALEDFLRAPTWKERLAFCLNPEQIRREMADYYATSSDGPQSYTSALFVASSPLPGPKPYTVGVFHVTFPDLPQGFPIPVEQTDNGWKIDWRAFVEFRDSRLKEFFTKYQDPPAVFRVQLQRTHYYDKDVPNLDEKYCFRVTAPIHGHDGYVFVDKRDSIAVPKLEGKLDWDLVHHVMVKLKWVKGTGGHPYVELRDIAANSWRDGPPPRLGQK